MACINGTCQDAECPNDCCVLGFYLEKPCPKGMECENYTCEKSICPEDIECCNQTYYTGGECRSGYECKNGLCFAKDSDGDGLADIAEANWGSDPELTDTDSDGINDFHEVMTYGTDPSDKNSDDDRYLDGEDDEPLKTNSASLNVTIVTTVEINHTALHAIKLLLDFNQSMDDPNVSIAIFHSWVSVGNSGDDITYTHNFTYDISIWCHPGVNPARNPFIRRYIGNGTNISIASNGSMSSNAPYYDDRGAITVNNQTIVSLKSQKVTNNRPLDAGQRYTKKMDIRLLFSDIPALGLEPVASERRCWYNVTAYRFEFDSFQL